MTRSRRCARCGAGLEGLRRDARWCGAVCRNAGYRERREARLVAEAVAATEARLAGGVLPLSAR